MWCPGNKAWNGTELINVAVHKHTYYNNLLCHMNNDYHHYYYVLLSMTKTKLTSKTLYFETLKQNLTYYAFSPTK